jgi:serine/threonine protein kinase
MVMEPLGESLFDYVKANEYRPLPLYCVQSFADQLVRAVAFLHELRLVHTDLKLENILLVSREGFHSVEKPTSQRDKLRGRLVLAPVGGTAIKLIDFGGATFDFEAKSSLINTRQYRAPEVILGLGWGTPSDVWSLGW